MFNLSDDLKKMLVSSLREKFGLSVEKFPDDDINVFIDRLTTEPRSSLLPSLREHFGITPEQHTDQDIEDYINEMTNKVMSHMF